MTDSPDRRDLALPDFDHIPIGMLPTRIAALDEQQLTDVLTYEREHGDRLPVVQVLEHRLAALRDGAEPSESVPTDLPEVQQGSTGSPVSPATSGPPMNPPSHGDPTNPAQPR